MIKRHLSTIRREEGKETESVLDSKVSEEAGIFYKDLAYRRNLPPTWKKSRYFILQIDSDFSTYDYRLRRTRLFLRSRNILA